MENNIIDFKEARKKLILKKIKNTPTSVIARKILANPEYLHVLNLLLKGK
jgi:hypothetical protein